MTGNSITLRFTDEATANYVRLICRRKSITLEDYIIDNFEWDGTLQCLIPYIQKINSNVCEFCEYINSCPDAVKA